MSFREHFLRSSKTFHSSKLGRFWPFPKASSKVTHRAGLFSSLPSCNFHPDYHHLYFFNQKLSHQLKCCNSKQAFSHWLRGQEKKKVGFFDSADSQRDGKSALSGFAQIWYKWKPLRHESFMPRSTKFCSLPLIPHKDPAKLSEYKILLFTPLSPIWLISKTDLSYLNWLSPPAISLCLKRTHGYS